MTPETRSRLALIGIVALFLAPFLVAVWLRFSGWQPQHTRNFGTLIQPPLELQSIALTRADGSAYAYEPLERIWQVVVLPPPDCGKPCLRLADALYRVWMGEGRKADKVRILWFGPLPAEVAAFPALIAMQESPALRAALPGMQPTPEGLPVFLIDPKGFGVMHYPPGFEPRGLLKDLGRLIK